MQYAKAAYDLTTSTTPAAGLESFRWCIFTTSTRAPEQSLAVMKCFFELESSLWTVIYFQLQSRAGVSRKTLQLGFSPHQAKPLLDR